jgi:hypothetical protein
MAILKKPLALLWQSVPAEKTLAATGGDRPRNTVADLKWAAIAVAGLFAGTESGNRADRLVPQHRRRWANAIA